MKGLIRTLIKLKKSTCNQSQVEEASPILLINIMSKMKYFANFDSQLPLNGKAFTKKIINIFRNILISMNMTSSKEKEPYAYHLEVEGTLLLM